MGSSRQVFRHAADLHVDGPQFDAMLLDFRTAMFRFELFEDEIDDGLDDARPQLAGDSLERRMVDHGDGQDQHHNAPR